MAAWGGNQISTSPHSPELPRSIKSPIKPDVYEHFEFIAVRRGAPGANQNPGYELGYLCARLNSLSQELPEFDLDDARWDISPERMKMDTPHIVPLSRQAVEGYAISSY